MFDQDEDRDRKICNLSSDCEPVVELCVANKCVEKKELFSAFAKNKKAYEWYRTMVNYFYRIIN